MRLAQFYYFKKLVHFFIHFPFGEQDRVAIDGKIEELKVKSLNWRPQCQ